MGTIIRVLAGLLSITLAATVHAEDPKVFFGNLHSHTSYSDGSGTPEQAYRHARDVAKLDLLAITDGCRPLTAKKCRHWATSADNESLARGQLPPSPTDAGV